MLFYDCFFFKNIDLRDFLCYNLMNSAFGRNTRRKMTNEFISRKIRRQHGKAYY